MDKKTIILIDGHYCLYQTHFSFLKLKNNNGEPTGVVYGYIKIFNKLTKIFNPKKIITIFDTPTQNFRHKLYTQYKNNRPPIPENLKKQIQPLQEIIRALGIPIVSINNIEADDIIGTLSKQFSKKKYYVLIYSADKDLIQLINKQVSIIPGNFKKEILNKNNVYKKYGISPTSIADFLSLVGDSSDNIPGVPGIGKKTAMILLKHFVSIKDIYNNIEKIYDLPIKNIKNITNKLKENKKIAFLSYHLTKINKNILIDNFITTIKYYPANIPLLLQKFKYYQFNQYIENIYNNQFPIINMYKKKKNHNKCIEIINLNVLSELIKQIIKKKIFSIAMFTATVNKKNNIFSMSISTKNHTTWWYVSNQKKSNTKSINKIIILNTIKSILEDEKYRKIGTNLKNIFHLLKKFNITLNGMYFDTSIACYNYKLSNTYKNYQKYLINTHPIKYTSYNLEKLIHNITQESLMSLKIYLKTKDYFSIKDKKKIFYSIDMPLLQVLSTMENNGVLKKKKILKKQKKKTIKTLNKLKKKIYYITQEKFNIKSNKQIQYILFKKYNFPHIQKTKSGNISTNEKVLLELSKIHKLPKIILQYRILSKLKNTYLTKLIQLINKKTNKIHTTYHQTSTSTGRLSSRNPNLQNIPIKTKLGRKIRIAFIVKKKWLLLTADYSQIELRIMAHYSQDKKMIQDLSFDQDIHLETAKHIFKIKSEQIKSYHRNIAKVINFSILYGISPFGLSQQLNISILEASEYIKNYFLTYRKIKKYIKYIYHIAKKNKYITTLFGRNIYIPDINSTNKTVKNYAKRFCINSIIQNTASDIIKTSMIKLHTIFKKNFRNDAKIIMHIHDELIFEIKEEKKKPLIHLIKHYMENSTKLITPLYISIKIGKNWKELKSYTLNTSI
ncbi:DNA polymerase I [Buchnera aphidicola (Cinara kochiana kochiana)]|uniref:DNA polymerase I n=1 Tax=Buchnera aphidicola (Cinara kochiana kochiana) TaxID=2518976 RepID=A0A451D5Q2_9GAMM|nr:DNA polymerase I [Buchnera aphidicola]VFP81179.1 DNA polymerase I [Buchnera aphidicola (Cinara kochiana kochiana)]